ncbi:PPM2 [[Candida] subhashii]|uniref:PPM2 n=1 Tax=[Candida] subhashii TaxID=561895 RepID=A0A8J5QBZ8_9ASCO|nr:PPM2 [[Candida] subhashii]KAG7662436.1 PPM2 [[Candida] subhashii]
MLENEKIQKLDANQLARQRKKIEKDRRKKVYDDQQVQGTNNSSIVSKRSVEMLYLTKLQPELGEWFKHFVKKGKRRSPAINRGYWIRMETIMQMVVRIMKLNPSGKIHVVNLGCGFDPLPFQLLSLYPDYDLNFIDIDYPDLIQNKYDMIQQADEIKGVIGTQSESTLCKISTNNYKLVGCDLKNLKLYEEILPQLVEGDSSIKIFIAEVSLAYMKPEFANPVIEISSKVSNSHFLILEQIMPDSSDNAFATKMLYHFNHLRSPIQCVEHYSTKAAQLQRFKQYYPNAEIKNLFENWLYLIDEESKRKVFEIEEFDEWEEFIIFCQHYVVVHATNSDQMIYECENGEIESQEYPTDESVSMSLDDRFDNEQLELKFPAVAASGDNIYINGGLKQTRTNETLALDIKNGTLLNVAQDENAPPPRMCHTLTTMGDKMILMGGRSRPGYSFQDVYKFQDNAWEKISDLELKRARHSAVQLNERQILVFGGLESGTNSDNSFMIYDVESGENKHVKLKGDNPGNLASSSIIYNGEYGLISGGIIDHFVPVVNDKLYKFTIEGDVINIKEVFQHPLLSRIGSQIRFLDSNKLLVVGGISPLQILTRRTNIMTLDLTNFTWKSFEIPQDIRSQHPPIFIGFGLVEEKRNDGKQSFVIVGGGAVCYSFGSCFNTVYRLDIL